MDKTDRQNPRTLAPNDGILDLLGFVLYLQGEMMMQDKLEKERCDAKNAVEEYVYEMRDKIANVLAQFIKEEVRYPHKRTCY